MKKLNSLLKLGVCVIALVGTFAFAFVPSTSADANGAPWVIGIDYSRDVYGCTYQTVYYSNGDVVRSRISCPRTTYVVD